MLRQVSLVQNTILLASLASLGLIPVNTVSPLCVYLFRCYFSPHYSRVGQEGGGIASLLPFSSSSPSPPSPLENYSSLPPSSFAGQELVGTNLIVSGFTSSGCREFGKTANFADCSISTNSRQTSLNNQVLHKI